MYNIKQSLTRLCGALLAVPLLAVTVSTQAAIISLEPADTITSTGAQVTLDLTVSALGGLAVGDFDIDIGYDTSRLSLSSFAVQPTLLGDIGLFEADDFSLGDFFGAVNVSMVSYLTPGELLGLQGDAFSLASFVFDVLDLGVGNSTLVTVDNIFAIGDQNGSPLDITSTSNALLRNPAISVNEPGGLLLLAGVLALLATRRRRFAS